jgi:hypothetical protein
MAQVIRTNVQSIPEKIADHLIAELALKADQRSVIIELMNKDITDSLEALSTPMKFR